MTTLLIEPKDTMPPRTNARSPRQSGSPRKTAETLATQQRDISVSEFFAKNRHLLGFDNPRKAMLTTVKEAVDNSLDACEEAGILPDITIVIEDLQPDRPANAKSSRYRVTVVDNGPGIVKKQVEHIFGRLLYGSKFHRLKMSRGQQGIGISAAGMYGLLTTGRPMVIHTRPSEKEKAHHIELAMNTKTNRAEVTDSKSGDFPPARFATLTEGTRQLSSRGDFLSKIVYRTGTSVSIELEAKYQRGRGSVDEFLELTAIANPHARITFVPPSRITTENTDDTEEEFDFRTSRDREGADPPAAAPLAHARSSSESVMTTESGGVTVFPRAIEALPEETKEIQPHPRGVELGALLQMLKEAEAERSGYSLFNFLQDKFCRVSPNTASRLCRSVKLTSRTRVVEVDHAKAEALFRELQQAKLPPPPTNCLAPIGVRQLLAGLLKGVRAEFYAASTRPAAVYRGRPFAIEAAVAFGGDLPADESARVIRFANRVPLLYQQSACSSFKAVVETNWRNYGMQHPKGSAPVGPLVVMIHMASVWVPFTSESKEAIADYDEIRKEMRLALNECGRKLGIYLRKRARMKREGERRDVFQKYIGEIAQAAGAITGTNTAKFHAALLKQAKKKTAMADVELDEDGKPIKPGSRRDDENDDDGVVIVESAAIDSSPSEPSPTESHKPSRTKPARAKTDTDQPALLARTAQPATKPSTRRRVAQLAPAAAAPSRRKPSASRPKRIRIGKGRDNGSNLF